MSCYKTPCDTMLVNVCLITVPDGQQANYLQFSETLNEYLRCKYSNFYLCSQIYQNPQNTTQFTVVAFYRNTPCIYGMNLIIQNDITNMYLQRWGQTVIKTPLVSFASSPRVQ